MTNATATGFSNAVRALEVEVGIEPGDGRISAAEVGTANDWKLVRQIAAISDSFDPVNVTSDSSGSIGAKRGTWALGMYAQHDEDDPNSIPIGTPLVSLLIAAALVSLPVVFA